MKAKKILLMFLVSLLADIFPINALAGQLVWGPKKYERGKGEPLSVIELFSVDKPKGKFHLMVENGGTVQKPGAEYGIVLPVDQASSAYVKLNSVKVVGTEDLNQNIFAVTKDITLLANNTIEVTVGGKPGSYIAVEIRKANLNEQVGNREMSLSGKNMKDQIVLWWSYEEKATEYILYKAYSIDGPWMELERSYPGEPFNTVDITQDAQIMDLCYKIEALDSKARVIKRYEPICVPKWEEEEDEGSLPLSRKVESSDTVNPNSYTGLSEKTCSPGRNPPSIGFDESGVKGFRFATHRPFKLKPFSIQLASINEILPQSSPPPYNAMCLSDSEFEEYDSMDASEIQNFLKDNGSFLWAPINDVDGEYIHPYQLIHRAAQTYRINPQVILTTLQKEQGAIEAKEMLENWRLKLIMGYDTSNLTTIRDQILDATAQMRRDFDRLSNGRATAGGWQVNVTKDSLDPLPVTPANKAVAILFSYTPWVGKDWGGRKGGNALFCNLWEQYKFGKPCPETSYEITITGPDAATDGSQYAASGGIIPYSWSITKGTIDNDGIVTVSGQCGAAAINVTDGCGNVALKDVRMPIGYWRLEAFGGCFWSGWTGCILGHNTTWAIRGIYRYWCRTRCFNTPPSNFLNCVPNLACVYPACSEPLCVTFTRLPSMVWTEVWSCP